jgi:hypothetical protein
MCRRCTSVQVAMKTRSRWHRCFSYIGAYLLLTSKQRAKHSHYKEPMLPPCVACKCLVPTNGKPGRCFNICGIWPCWHDGLTALHPAIMERACQGAIRCVSDPEGVDLLNRHQHLFEQGFSQQGECVYMFRHPTSVATLSTCSRRPLTLYLSNLVRGWKTPFPLNMGCPTE